MKKVSLQSLSDVVTVGAYINQRKLIKIHIGFALKTELPASDAVHLI